MPASQPVLPVDLAACRADFPILQRRVHDDLPLTYLDNAASTQRPQAVLDAMLDAETQHYANVHRGIHTLSEEATELYEKARLTVQKFLGASRFEEVIFTRGATEGINLVARSWADANLKQGDEILLTLLEHHSNIVPWQQASERTGAKVRWLPITDDGHLDLAALPEYLTTRTKLFAFTAASNVLGTMPPIGELTAAARAVGAVTVVDAAQLAPHAPLNVAQLGADFVAFSGHKMLGPSGIGVLWGRTELLDAMPAFQGGGSMIGRVTLEGFTPAELPAKFEAGTPAIVPAVGLGAAIEYLQRFGLDTLHRHEQRLVRLAHDRLAAIEGVKILGPSPEDKTGIVSFEVENVHAHDVAQVLDRHGVAIRAGHHCAMPLHTQLGVQSSARASFYLYNTPEEVERLATAVESVFQVFRSGGRRRRS